MIYKHTSLYNKKSKTIIIIGVRSSAWQYGYDRQVQLDNLTPLQIKMNNKTLYKIGTC